MSIAVLPELAAAPTRRVSWALLRRPAPLISLIFFVLLIGAVLLVPWLGLPDPLAQDLSHVMQMPSGGHVLGTDTLGRDIFSRLLWGGRPALWGALEATAVFATVGIVLGLAAGYSHGATDRFISGAVDVMGSLPSIVVVFAVLSLFGNDLSAAMIAAGFFGSYGLIRIVRAATQETREELFVAAAKVSGIGPLRILARHVLPRLVNPIVVQLTIYFGLALVLQSGLGFLNLGVPAPKPSWGGMVGEGATVVQQFPWLLVPPGVTIALTVLATVLLGETLQEMTGRNASRVRLSRHHRTTISRTAESTTSTASTADALLEVRGLTVALPTPNGAKTVVRQITFSVSPGELVGLVGESGSGKTITALSLLGLLPEGSTVTAAALRFDGADLLGGIDSFRTIRGSGIGLVSQEPMVALDPSFTIGHQLGEVLLTNGHGNRRSVRALVLQSLSDVRLPDPAAVADRYPFQLSGGMAQRVGIAMALAGEPKLLIADEPTTALDVTVQAEILDLLRLLRDERGMAVILVTHNLGVVADFCERVIVMQNSRLIEQAPVHEIFEHPTQEYTRALLAATPSLIDLPMARNALTTHEEEALDA